MSRIGSSALLALLVLVGAAAWALQLRAPLRVDARSLERLPRELGGWQGRDLPLEQAVEAMLRADLNVQRGYRHPLGGTVWLYVGYYGTERGGVPEHTPRQCYRAHGWSLSEGRTVRVEAVPGLRANELVAELEGRRRLVRYWYRSGRRSGILSPLGLHLDHVLGRLTSGRADGALVRISTPLEGRGALPGARRRLEAFARALAPALAERWPAESSEG